MNDVREPFSIALLALPETTASTIFGMYDLFCSVGRDWSFITTGEAGEPKVRPVLVSSSTKGFRMANGVWVNPDMAFDDFTAPDLICIPDLFVSPGADISRSYPDTLEWLKQRHQAGTTIAAACSGTLLLAEAGLLDGADATTHWAYCAAMREHYPLINVQGDRVLVASGEGQRILTSGGGTSWQDMVLFLIARVFGVEEARQIARIYLLDWHSVGQLPFAALSSTKQVEDKAIAVCQVWVAEHYEEPHAVAAMTHYSGLPERSFKRRFRQATGMAPIEYVHTLRLEEAKQMLESSDIPVEAVAVDVGYEDASFFRRLFRRKVGLSPSEYRKRFRVGRKVLEKATSNQNATIERAR